MKKKKEKDSKKPKCYQAVREYVLKKEDLYVTVERTAQELSLEQGQVIHCFHFLNLEGIIQNEGAWGGANRYWVYDRVCHRCNVNPKSLKGEWGDYCTVCAEKVEAQYDITYEVLDCKRW